MMTYLIGLIIWTVIAVVIVKTLPPTWREWRDDCRDNDAVLAEVRDIENHQLKRIVRRSSR